MIKISLLCACFIAAGVSIASGDDYTDYLNKARKLHNDMLTIDTHVDYAATLATPEHNPAVRQEEIQVDLVKMEEGGLDAVFFAVWTPQKTLTEEHFTESYNMAMDKFNAMFRMCAVYNSDLVGLATSADDIERIKASGKKSALIGVENGFAIGNDLNNLRYFYDLGARYMTITHIGYNQLGDSSNDKEGIPGSHFGGLSPFGKDVVREMNRLGMMVDVSHVAVDTFYDILDISTVPVIASHSGCKAVYDNARNLDDDQLLALKKNGGTIQIVAYGGYLHDPGNEATLQHFVDHVDHAVKTIGIDHVGIGSDFDGGGGIIGFNDASECHNVTAELLRRGYSEKDIRKIWGGNLLRVWREVEKAAER